VQVGHLQRTAVREREHAVRARALDGLELIDQVAAS
jgi:hypothetical protein